jgi:rare lipoprotein A
MSVFDGPFSLGVPANLYRATTKSAETARFVMVDDRVRFNRVAPIVVPVLALILPACAARSKAPVPVATRGAILEVREGLASYYGPGFDGKVTASGTRFDMKAMVAAHPSYPFGTVLRVTNVKNGRAVEVRVVDRGPARGPRADGVIIDLSYGAAGILNFVRAGRTRVRVEVLRWGG